MKRILVRLPVIPSGEYDIFNKTDISKLSSLIPELYGNTCPNLGNRLWYQGIVSVISTQENVVEFSNSTFDCEEINANYDLVVAPMANIFSEYCYDSLNGIAELYEQIKIPVFVIACGAQATSYDDLKRLCGIIREPATRFIRAICNTGGEFALRGYFTKELFNMLGFPSVGVVTGCPSLFQLGRDLKIEAPKVDKENLKPVFNGSVKKFSQAMKEIPDSVFIDQESMFKFLYEKNYLTNCDYRVLKEFLLSQGLHAAKCLTEKRIKLIPDMNDWRNFLINNEYNYSLGGRIHGNIMSILSGIPATVIAHDSRTREMAEFFNIPMIDSKKGVYTKQDVCETYLQADYTMFNQTFSAKFDDYEKFLIKCGIVTKANSNNLFFDKTEPISFEENLNKQRDFEEFYTKLLRAYPRVVVERILSRAKHIFLR